MINNVSRRQFLEVSGLVAAGLGLVGCGGSGSGSSDGSIKVGVMGPLSGSVAQYGTACRDGALLYIKQLNADGGINGKQVETDVQDEKGDATEAVTVYNKLVEEGVTAIIGDVTSKPTIAVAQKSAEDGMPCVTPSATTADVITYGDNYFRACVTDPFQGKVMADFAAQQGYKTVATIFDSGDDYASGVAEAFKAEATSKGLTVSSEQGYASGATDFNAQLTSIIATNPDAILSSNYYQDDGMIVTQARRLGYEGVFLGADGWSGVIGGDQDYASATDLEGCFYCSSFVASNPDTAVQKFISDFTDEYGSAPTNFNALGYDAAAIVCAGIKAAEEKGGTPGSDDYKKAVIEGIASGKVEGVTGTISYAGTGDPQKSTLIITFKSGVEEIATTIEA
ncbi:ABC transporter substrate-binding protein [Paratractidigestivibacter sp.]|uniref:ABC transporter substrate-binding protein n=1 Tax=Paratractidigestivibacter sp. TaxID=2847316 RepID=UPI002ABE92E6|nr:ABC transporter substrate-binding protein [Paratractidigestivibacter sp.]